MDDSTADEFFDELPPEAYCEECGTLLSVDQEDGANDTGLVDIYFCKNC